MCCHGESFCFESSGSEDFAWYNEDVFVGVSVEFVEVDAALLSRGGC